MSHVAVSFEIPEYVANADGLGTLRILDAVRLLGLEKNTRIYQASTSELYGRLPETPQTGFRRITISSKLSVCCRKNVRILDNSKLQRGL